MLDGLHQQCITIGEVGIETTVGEPSGFHNVGNPHALTPRTANDTCRSIHDADVRVFFPATSDDHDLLVAINMMIIILSRLDDLVNSLLSQMGFSMNITSRDTPANGLQQLQSLLASGRQVPIGDTMGFHLEEVTEGRAVFVSTPGPQLYNPIGSVHGGYAATLLDSACGCAVHSRLKADQAYTTLELKVAYHRGMTAETGPVRAIGTVLTMGRRVAFAEAKLLDDQDRLLASATSTLLVMERPAG